MVRIAGSTFNPLPAPLQLVQASANRPARRGLRFERLVLLLEDCEFGLAIGVAVCAGKVALVVVDLHAQITKTLAHLADRRGLQHRGVHRLGRAPAGSGTALLDLLIAGLAQSSGL